MLFNFHSGVIYITREVSIMTVIKRKKTASNAQLITAMHRLCYLLEAQDEDEAIQDLKKAMDVLEKSLPGSQEHGAALKDILDAFEGEHELSAYTMRRESMEGWSDSEELYLSSLEVLNYVKRLLD